MSHKSKYQQGFILVVVLWLTVLLSLMALTFSRSVQIYIRDTAGTLQSKQAEMLADAGVNLAVLDLLSARSDARYERRFHIDGGQLKCEIDNDVVLIIRVQDAGGMVNINLADIRLLASLFSGMGVPAEQALQYADRIADFKDRDDERRAQGAERQDYTDAGAVQGPKNAPFDSREELFQVLGLDPANITGIWEFVTIHSASAGLDPETTSSKLASVVSAGASLLAGSQTLGTNSSVIPAEFIIASGRRSFELNVTAQLVNGTVFTREAEVDLPISGNTQPVFKHWNSGRNLNGAALQPDFKTLPRC